MYRLIIFLTFATCFSQTKTETNVQRLIHKWQFVNFEEADRKDHIVTITKTKFVQDVFFIFNEDFTLDVVYTDKLTEKYLWRIRKNILEITAVEQGLKNPKIEGLYTLIFLDKLPELFLQRLNKPHNGITLIRKHPK